MYQPLKVYPPPPSGTLPNLESDVYCTSDVQEIEKSFKYSNSSTGGRAARKEAMSDDLHLVCSNSPQFDELSTLAAKYKEDVRNFGELEGVLNSSTTDRGGGNMPIDLGAELFRCRVLNRQWLERCISNPVAKETDDFVRRVCSALRQTEQPCHAGQNEARHGIHEFRLIPEVSGIIARGVTEAVLLAGGDARGAIATRVVRELDIVWADVCVPIIEGERKSLEYDLPAIRKLGAFVLRLMQMNSNSKGAATLHATASCEFSSVVHTFHRVYREDWYTASRVPSSDLLDACTKEFDDATGQRLCEWLSTNGRAFHDALVVDCISIEELRGKSEFAEEWHGLVVQDSSLDPSADALITPPSYLKSFQSDTGRIYACARTAHGGSLRVLGVVRCLFVLRHMIANGLFSLGKFDCEYAKTLVGLEKQRIAYKTTDVISKLLLICQDFEFATDAATIDKFVDSIVEQRTSKPASTVGHHQLRNPGVAASAVCAIPSSSSLSGDPYSVHTPQRGRHGLDYLVKPYAKLKSIDFKPSRVARASLVEYVVVVSLASAVNEVLSHRTLSIVAIGISNSALVDRVASNITSLRFAKGSAMGRVIDNGNGVNRAALTQMISQTVRKLLKAGSEAVDVAHRAGAPGTIAWNCTYKPTRSTNELLLHIGIGVTDPCCYVFLDACLRVKSYLDESWPLPCGFTWARVQPRRGKARRAGPKEAEDAASDGGDATAETSVA